MEPVVEWWARRIGGLVSRLLGCVGSILTALLMGR